MTGRYVLRRVLVVMGALCGFLFFLAITQSQGTPIRPDVKKLVNQPQQQEMQFAPARAGWNGPEMARSDAPSLALFGAASDPAAVRESLMSAFIPDPRAIALLAALILLLRQFRAWQASRRIKPTGAEVTEFPTPENPQELHPAA